jgi:hypothetical protein
MPAGKTQLKLKMPSASGNHGNRVLLENTYMVEFALDSADTNHFQKVTKSLKTSHNIQPSGIKKRYDILSSLFSAVSFTVIDNHPVEAIEMIEDAIAVYPVYTVQVPEPIKSSVSSAALDSSGTDYIRSYNLTGVTQVHEIFQNFGQGVRVSKTSSRLSSLFVQQFRLSRIEKHEHQKVSQLENICIS